MVTPDDDAAMDGRAGQFVWKLETRLDFFPESGNNRMSRGHYGAIVGNNGGET